MFEREATREWLACFIATVLAAPAPAAWAQQTRPTYYGSSPAPVYGQGAAPAASKPAGPPTTNPGGTFKQEELEQILAPIALFPDALPRRC